MDNLQLLNKLFFLNYSLKAVLVYEVKVTKK